MSLTAYRCRTRTPPTRQPCSQEQQKPQLFYDETNFQGKWSIERSIGSKQSSQSTFELKTEKFLAKNDEINFRFSFLRFLCSNGSCENDRARHGEKRKLNCSLYFFTFAIIAIFKMWKNYSDFALQTRVICCLRSTKHFISYFFFLDLQITGSHFQPTV